MDPHHQSIAAFDLLAEAYEARFMNVPLYDASYDHLARLIEPQGARVLELGCGPGNLTRALLRRRPDLRLLATDPAPNMLRLAAHHNPTAQTQLLDARDLCSLAGPFAAVVAGFCLPYLTTTDAATLCHEAARLLAPGGVCYLSFIADDYHRSGPEPSSDGRAVAHVYYHPLPAVKALLAAAGLAVVAEYLIPYPRTAAQTDTHAVLLARKTT